MIWTFEKADLIALAPPCKSGPRANIWRDYVEALMTYGPGLLAEHEIDTPLRLQHLMATWAHESDDFGILWTFTVVVFAV